MSVSSFISPFIPASVKSFSERASGATSRLFPTAVASPALPNGLAPEVLKKREKELLENQKLYQYEAPATIPGVAFVKGPVSKLPGQTPSFLWKVKAGLVGARITANFSGFVKAAGVVWDAVFTDQNDSKKVSEALNRFQNSVDSKAVAENVLRRFAKARVEGSQFEEKNPIIEPYRDMYNILEKPDIADIFLEDRVFNRLRVAGYNPLSLFAVKDESNMPFDISHMPHDGDTYVKAIAEKRLYALDFSFLSLIEQQRDSKKICVPTKALFVIPPGGGDLTSVAIEVETQVVYPPKENATADESTRWAIAKMAVNNDDAMHHELIAHLGKTHLLIEPFVAATMRQLPSSHPLHVLLKPHFEGTIFINDNASTDLVSRGGNVDKIFAGEIDSVMKWCAAEVVNNKFNASMPDVDLQDRGAMNPMLDMPYRDDALEHFDAMYDWVFGYLSHYYKSDTDVMMDLELQSWVSELTDPSRGRVRDFGDDGSLKIRTLKYLARAVTFVIFSSSVQHAAVNFPQLPFMSYAPAVAGGLWKHPPKPEELADLICYKETLTPIQTAIEQVTILAVLGDVYYTQLGQYRRGEMPNDKPVQDALKKYRARLAAIDKRIAKREKNSFLKYEFMRPGNVPQSINI